MSELGRGIAARAASATLSHRSVLLMVASAIDVTRVNGSARGVAVDVRTQDAPQCIIFGPDNAYFEQQLIVPSLRRPVPTALTC